MARKRHQKHFHIKKDDPSFRNLIAIAVWISGVLVALAVGFGMIDNTLAIRFVPQTITEIFGWVIVVLTILGAVLAIFESIKNSLKNR